MKKLLAITATLILSTTVLFADGLSGFLGVTSNYVARGTAQNYSGYPAGMFNLNYDYKGFYVGGFTANVDFGENQIGLQKYPTYLEYDGWVGYRHDFLGATFDLMFGSYNYAGDTFTNLDMVELKLTKVPEGDWMCQRCADKGHVVIHEKDW